MSAIRFAVVSGIVAVLLAALAPAQESREITGWYALMDRLGADFPTGDGIDVLQTEAPAPGYLPFIGMGSGEFLGKTNIDLTGGGATSGHAGTVGRRWYGNSAGYAPGVTTVYSYEANNYLQTWLDWSARYPSGDWDDFVISLDPEEKRIANNSWILTSSSQGSLRALLRSDFQTEYYGFIYVNAVNNGGNTDVPPGLSSSFNSIVVGRSDGGSSAGPTIEEPGRMKPDMVAPDTATSWAAPQVAGAVAMMLEQARELGNPDAERPQVVKAIMMAAAHKLAGWNKGDDGPEDDAVHPIDWRQGAGELRVDRNYDIMDAGPFPANGGNRVKFRGWSYDTIAFNETNDYWIQVATVDSTLSVSLAWHRHHLQNFFIDGAWPLNNIAMEVWEANGNGMPVALLQESRSLLDNIQHVYLTGLPPGNYLVRLLGLTDNNPGVEDYGLAWWSSGTVVLGDMNGDGALDGADIDPFFLALGDPGQFMMEFPGVEPDVWGDANGDASFDGADIDAFFDLLGG